MTNPTGNYTGNFNCHCTPTPHLCHAWENIRTWTRGRNAYAIYINHNGAIIQDNPTHIEILINLKK